jgi:serine/threonine protein kinase
LLHEGVCKIADFGFARLFFIFISRVIDSGMEDIHGYSKLGTPLYMSP